MGTTGSTNLEKKTLRVMGRAVMEMYSTGKCPTIGQVRKLKGQMVRRTDRWTHSVKKKKKKEEKKD